MRENTVNELNLPYSQILLTCCLIIPFLNGKKTGPHKNLSTAALRIKYNIYFSFLMLNVNSELLFLPLLVILLKNILSFK